MSNDQERIQQLSVHEKSGKWPWSHFELKAQIYTTPTFATILEADLKKKINDNNTFS